MSKRSRRHNKNITQSAMSELLDMIKYKTNWYLRECTTVGQYYPSTKVCNNCGFQAEKLATTIRMWECPKCGTVHDRDANAAINIRNEGLKLRQNN